jgi:hypothetical protein
LNVALHNSPDEYQQQTFLRYIEELTVWHLRILLLYHDVEGHFRKHPPISGQNVGGASQLLELAFPELAGRRELYDQIVNDLHSRGLMNATSSFLHSMMSGNGAIAKRTTSTCDAFLAFITSPLRSEMS